MIDTLRQHMTSRTGRDISLFVVLLGIFWIVPVHFANAFIESTIWSIASHIGGLFLWLGGTALDLITVTFINDMGSWINGPLGNAIRVTWELVRDTFNLFFIFGLIYIGIRIILNSQSSSAKSHLAYLIAAALLINFSLFFTQAITDFTNVTAIQMRTIMYEKVIVNGAQMSEADGVGIGSIFGQVLGFQSIAGEASLGDEGVDKGIGYSFAILIFTSFTGLVFLAGAAMILIRFVALAIFMAISPVMFLGWIIPFMQRYTSMWWSKFLSYAFFAPIFFFMMFLSLTVLVNGRTSLVGGEGDNIAGNFTPGGSIDSIIFLFVALAFIIGSIIISQKMSVVGADTSMAAVRHLRRGWTYGPRSVARNTTNKSGEKLERAVNKLSEQKESSNRFLRGLQRATTKSTAFVQAGKRTASNMQNAKYGTGTTVKQNRETRADIENRTDFAETKKAGLAALEIQPQHRTREQEQKINKMRSNVTNLSAKQFEQMDQSEREELAEFMTDGQFDKLMDSDNLNAAQKNALYGQRQQALQDSVKRVVGDQQEVIAEELHKLSVKQVETLGDEFIRKNIDQFSEAQMDDLAKSKSLTDNQKADYKAARKTEQVKKGISPDIKEREEIFMVSTAQYDQNGKQIKKKRKPNEIAKIPSQALVHPDNVMFLSSTDLKEIEKSPMISYDEQMKIKKNIENSNNEDAKNYLKSPRGIREWGEPTKKSST